MNGSADVRAVTATAVAAVLGIQPGKNASLDRVLRDPGYQPKADMNRARFRAWCYETLRCYHRLDRMLAQLLEKPLRRRDLDIYALLLLAAMQLEDPDCAEHAIVSESVTAAENLRKPRMKGLINAVLRRFIDRREELTEIAMRDLVGKYSHPQWLIDQIKTDWPRDWQEILESNNKKAPMWIRVNRRKNTREQYAARLAESSISVHANEAPIAADAIRLELAVDVGALPGFADGCVSVQDAAAQLAAHVLNAQPGMRVLDACAAPGGKTCHLLELANNNLDVQAVDKDRIRLQRVRENLDRLHLDARLIHADVGETAAWWDRRCYQRILLDVPCSATGVIRRHPDIKVLRRASDIDALAHRQRKLLESLWPLLEKGGYLLYSSCSILRAENQSQIECFLKNQKDAELLSASDSLTKQVEERLNAASTGPGLQLLPGRMGADGFFYALIGKA